MTGRKGKEQRIVKLLLSKYYSEASLSLPSNYMLREFAFQPFEGESYIRHLSFQSLASLREYLRSKTPRQAYYSSAIYRDPAAERMEDKGWLGSELMFDIDVDHLNGCDGITIESGNGRNAYAVTQRCIDIGKEHLLRLIDILNYELGFPLNTLLIYFTGNRGFHVVVQGLNEEWMNLTSKERREIVDYIKGVGLKLNSLFPKGRLSLINPSPNDGGWRTRIALSELSISELLSSPESFINRLIVEIDEQVTQDISRLIRIPGSINGKSGLPAVILSSEEEIHRFTLSTELSPFKGYALVRTLRKLPKVKILEEEISMERDQVVKVELPIAVFLDLNGLARIIKIL